MKNKYKIVEEYSSIVNHLVWRIFKRNLFGYWYLKTAYSRSEIDEIINLDKINAKDDKDKVVFYRD